MFNVFVLLKPITSYLIIDLISICETSLNDSVELPLSLLNDYTFVPANNPLNTRNGGVGFFYKNSLPVIVQNDLSFDESIVVELKFGRKKIFFTVLYQTPSCNHTSPEFQDFLSKFETLVAWWRHKSERHKNWRTFLSIRSIPTHLRANKFWTSKEPLMYWSSCNWST